MHRIHCYEYVNRPYERVSEALVLGAVSIFQRATQSAAARASSIVSTLKVDIGHVEIGKDVVITVQRIDRTAHASRLGTEATGARSRMARERRRSALSAHACNAHRLFALADRDAARARRKLRPSGRIRRRDR